MTLIKFKSNPVDNLLYDSFPVFNGIFNDFFNENSMSRSIVQSLPAVNISENDNNFTLELAAPGMKKEDFKVELENDVLSIRVEKEKEKVEENSNFSRKEFAYSSFSRSFNLPENVNADSISASYTNGILSLTVPKKETVKKPAVKAISIS